MRRALLVPILLSPLIAAALVLAPLELDAQDARRVRVTWSPSRPVQGGLVTLVARPTPGSDPVLGVRGEAAGEPLHFEHAPAGVWEAVAAIPIDATDSLAVRLVVARAAAAETVAVRLPVTAGSYRMEQLRVARRFGTAPDSALRARIDAEAARAREVSCRAHDTPRMWRGRWAPPRDSRITSGFGHGRAYNGKVQSRHMGVDFAGPVGTPVRAPNRGLVALVDTFFLGGRVVYIDHGAGLVTAYLHLSRVSVAIGDTVARGTVIGHVGATGRVTGPHLHWLARYGAITVNPLSLLEGQDSGARRVGMSARHRRRT